MFAYTTQGAARTPHGSARAALMLVAVGVLGACHDAAAPKSPVEEPLGDGARGTAALVAATNTFSLRLFQAIEHAAGSDSNVFISPLSASTALGMAATGAHGATLDSMQAVLGYAGASVPAMDAAYASLLHELGDADPHVTLRLANSLWYDRTIVLLPAFVSSLRTDFWAPAGQVDFTSPTTIALINAWADSATQGFIPQVLTELPLDTKVLLANAVYFHGLWTQPFDPNKTASAPFTTASGATTSASFMNNTLGLVYAKGADYLATDLPFASGAFTMTVVVPQSGTPLGQLVDELAGGGWDALTRTLDDSLNRGAVAVVLPKFEVTWSDGLKPALTTLGMGIAFNDLADFSNMTHSDRLEISQVLQSTHVSVNEQGATAAAVTTVHFTPIDVVEPTVTVRADHPFLYAIRERATGAVLFLGALAHPAATAGGA